ncbi:dihydroxyacetone kinase subunit DhaK [Pseudohoeflea coraliihabitans]|uniref:Dihydroxyacetone kinase subunit DhaK n=1 Tax=Pseudohoeflea coraliihabitans TaxID=2860393 RepID=A0ABS6WJY7_9HYPH|nr:dihydroxyacetone kinase subunit DhaK [Pseudohoeflea sp. DP4N28-3]MBW3096261.1 dihydroxyacetone kinase subunit DhaK [Pseudohoeflea sp. DP4N28-3]
MKKLINNPDYYVDEALEGMRLAHPRGYTVSGSNGRVIERATRKSEGKVGIVSGGGFGHLPLFAGYVGEGLLDSCAVGHVFAGPSFDDVSESLKAADFGGGVLSVIGNYGGDTMVFGMANDMLAAEGTDCAVVTVADDVASAPRESAETRRGVAGLILAFKIAGAAAEKGMNLQGVKAVTERAMTGCRSIGVALSGCTVPQAGTPTFVLDENSIEMGMGIHGEKGLWRGALKPADEIASEMVERLMADLEPPKGARLAVLVNSLGATPLDELYILYRKVSQLLNAAGLEIAYSLVGHYATSMEMAGASLSVMTVDDELLDLLNAPVNCPLWRA